MSRKQRILAKKMYNKLYSDEALLAGTSVLNIFRIHYKANNAKRKEKLAAHLAAISK